MGSTVSYQESAVVEDSVNVHFKEYWLSISIGPGCGLGLNVKPSATKTELTITRILDGPVSNWNKGHPQCRVRQGDSILEVNGIRDNTTAMLATFRRSCKIRMLLRCDSEYTVVVQRPPGPKPGLDVKVGSRIDVSNILDGLLKRWNTDNPHLQVSSCDRIVSFNKILLEESNVLQMEVHRELQWLVDNLPIIHGGDLEATECAICLSTFDVDSLAKRMPCKHEYCVGCLDHWLLLYGGACPLCRANVNSSDAAT